MLTSKQTTLRPLFESKDGIHLTAYLVNRGDLDDLKVQLRLTINETYEWLCNALSVDERKKFLEPLDSLLNDATILTQMKGNIGIFRNEESFRILNIPIAVEQSCQVATSFHVKPLLRWLQGDQDFLLLGFEQDFAHLYFGNMTSCKLVDSILLPTFPHQEPYFGDASNLMTASTWLNDWIEDMTKTFQPKLFLAGDPSLVKAANLALKYKHTVRTPVSSEFSPDHTSDAFQLIQNILKTEASSNLEKALLEFRFAEEGNRAKKNIFQISKAVVQGRVRKLIVTDELSIFGKIDHKSGGLAIHPFDLDHEDDCILDDLAQMVLSQGGEVIVAKRSEIPKGRPILAILDDEDIVVEKDDVYRYRDLQSRCG